MAKTYMKPAFAFHQIPLAGGVGTGCNRKGTSAEYVCGIYDKSTGLTLFSDSSNCNFAPQTDENGNPKGVCYRVPLGDAVIFNS